MLPEINEELSVRSFAPSRVSPIAGGVGGNDASSPSVHFDGAQSQSFPSSSSSSSSSSQRPASPTNSQSSHSSSGSSNNRKSNRDSKYGKDERSARQRDRAIDRGRLKSDAPSFLDVPEDGFADSSLSVSPQGPSPSPLTGSTSPTAAFGSLGLAPLAQAGRAVVKLQLGQRRQGTVNIAGGGGEEVEGGGGAVRAFGSFRNGNDNQLKDKAIMRRRSYDATLFGMDVFEGMQLDIEKKMAEIEGSWRFVKYIPIIHPDSTFQRFRDVLSVFVILYSVFSSLFDFVFSNECENPIPDKYPHCPTISDESAALKYFEFFISAFFWTDLALNFTTASYDNEEDLVTDRKQMVLVYLKSWFLVDFVSNLPLGSGLSLLKIMRLARFPRIFIRWANIGISTVALNLFKILIMTLCAGHIFACLFFYISYIEGHGPDNWTRKDFGKQTLFMERPIDGGEGGEIEVYATSTKGTQYLASLYFTYTTLTTVGYGDISATTNGERIVAIFCLVVGSGVFAGIVSTMSQLMDSISDFEAMKLAKLARVHQFIKSHHFTEATRSRIRKYYDLHFTYLQKELVLLEELSPALRHECMHFIYAKVLEKVPFLRDSPPIVQSAVLASVVPILCCAKDYLVTEGQVLNNIYIVSSGAIEVINLHGIVSRTYGIGSFFGEKCAFHSSYLSTVSYRAKGDVEVLSIDRKDFVNILNTYEEFANTFVMICQKREDHKKEVGIGSSNKMKRSAESMVRPVTPPPGTKWRGLPSSVSVRERPGGGGTENMRASLHQQESKLNVNSRKASVKSDLFDDESVSGLIDKLQRNLSLQLEEIQDHMDHIEDRLDDLEGDWGGDWDGDHDNGSPTSRRGSEFHPGGHELGFHHGDFHGSTTDANIGNLIALSALGGTAAHVSSHEAVKVPTSTAAQQRIRDDRSAEAHLPERANPSPKPSPSGRVVRIVAVDAVSGGEPAAPVEGGPTTLAPNPAAAESDLDKYRKVGRRASLSKTSAPGGPVRGLENWATTGKSSRFVRGDSSRFAFTKPQEKNATHEF